MFTKKTIRDIDLKGKRVLLRADYNVPLDGHKITDDYRINQSLPTIQYILDRGASLVIMSHLGRPDGERKLEFSLKPVAKRLSELLDKEVIFAEDCIGESARSAVAKLHHGKVVLLENLRFHAAEEANNEDFARQIIADTGAEIFVQDGFGVVHRAHASTEAIARQTIMGVAGLLLEKEVDTITNAMEKPERPLVAVVGGAKIGDKIEILTRLMEMADTVAVVGAMANNFIKATGYKVGKSLLDDDAEEMTENILTSAKRIEKLRPFNFLVPVDVVVSESLDGKSPTRLVDLSSQGLADIEVYPKLPKAHTHTVADDELILDIGPMSAWRIAGAIGLARTVIWNGTCGVTETKGIAGAADPFSHGTGIIVDAMIGESNQHQNRPFTVVGGGDTVGYVESHDLVEDFSHVSTGGGASLELMAGKKLPGVEVLWDH